MTDSTMTEWPVVASLIALADAPLPIGNDARLDLREAAAMLKAAVEALEEVRRTSNHGVNHSFEALAHCGTIADNALASLKQPGGR